MKFTTFAVDGEDVDTGYYLTLYWVSIAGANFWHVSAPRFKPKTDQPNSAYKHMLIDYGSVYEVEVEYVPETLVISRL